MKRLPVLLIVLFISLISVGVVLAEYTGPNRTHEVQVRDPENDIWTCYHSAHPPCTMHHPGNPCPDFGGSCPSVEQQLIWCGWVSDMGCSCNPAYTTHTENLPPATVSGSFSCASPGDNGWCRGGGSLDMSASEPLAGEVITYIEGSPGSLCDPPDAANISCSWSGGGEGNYSISYWAHSSYGDTSYQDSSTWRLDSVAPGQSLSESGGAAGQSGWYVGGTVTVSAAASDGNSGVALTQYRIDGGAWQTGTSADISNEGAHNVEFVTRDNAGNETSGSRTVRIDTAEPTSAFTNPAEGSQVTVSGTFNMSGASADLTSGVAGAEISINGGASWQALGVSGGSWSYSWNTRSVSNGSYVVQVRARDTAGNLESTARITVVVDNSPPLVDIPDSWYIWEEAPIKVSDRGIGVSRAQLTIHGGSYGNRKYKWSSSNIPSRFTWDRHFGDVVAPPGEYSVTLEGWDSVGNKGSDIGVILIPMPPTATAVPTATSTATATATDVPLIQQIFKPPDPTATPKKIAAVVQPAEPVVEIPITAKEAPPIWWPLMIVVATAAGLGFTGMFDSRPPAWRRLADIRRKAVNAEKIRGKGGY